MGRLLGRLVRRPSCLPGSSSAGSSLGGSVLVSAPPKRAQGRVTGAPGAGKGTQQGSLCTSRAGLPGSGGENRGALARTEAGTRVGRGRGDPGGAVAVALAREVAGAASGRLTGPADGLHRGPEERRSFKGLPASSHSRARCPPPLRFQVSPPSLPEHETEEQGRSHRHCHRAEQHRCARQTPCEWGASRVPRCPGAGGTRLQTHCHKRRGERVALVKMEERVTSQKH